MPRAIAVNSRAIGPGPLRTARGAGRDLLLLLPRERVEPAAGRRAALLRLVLALAGLVLVLHRPGAPWPWPRGAADQLALLGGAGLALTTVLLRRWRATPPPARVLAMFGGGFATATGLALAGLAGGLSPLALSTHGLAWLPWVLGLTLAFLAGNLALQYGAARLPARVTALIMLAEVVFASASAVLLGAATPTGWTWAGGVLILLAALLSILPGRRAGG